MARDLQVGVELIAEDRASRVLAAFEGELGKIGDSTESLARVLRQLGVDLEQNVEKKIEANNRALAAAAKAFQEGRISAGDFARAAEAVGAANAKLAARIGESGEAADRAQGRLSRFTDFLRSRFVVTLGDVARAAQAAFGLIERTASLEGAEEALRRNLAAQGIALDGYIAKLREVSAGTVSTAEIIQNAGKAILLGIPAEEIASLLEIARASAVATGESVTKAFQDIVTGVGRGSPAILDNLGIVVNAEKAYEAYGEAISKSATELTDVEKKQAILNEVLTVGKERVEAIGTSMDSTAERIAKGRAAFSDLTDFLGGAFTQTLNTVLGRGAQGLAFIAEGTASIGRAISSAAQDLSDLPIIGGLFDTLATNTARSATENLRFAATMREASASFLEAAAAQDELNNATGRTAQQSQQLIDSYRSAGPVLVTYGKAATDAAAAIGEHAESYDDAIDGARRYAQTVLNETIPALDAAGQKAAQVAPLISGVLGRDGREIQGVVGFSQGGTRAELVGGGSRLVGRVGGSFGSQQRVSSDATYIVINGRRERIG